MATRLRGRARTRKLVSHQAEWPWDQSSFHQPLGSSHAHPAHPSHPPPALFSSKRLKRPVYSHHPHSLRNPPPSVCCPPTPWRLPSRSFSLTSVFPTNTLVPLLFLYAVFKMDTFHHSVKPSSLSFRSPGRLVPPPTLFSESPPSVSSSVSHSVSSVFPSQAHGPVLSPCPHWAPSHVKKNHTQTNDCLTPSPAQCSPRGSDASIRGNLPHPAAKPAQTPLPHYPLPKLLLLLHFQKVGFI